MEANTQSQIRLETFSQHAQSARSIADTALAEIDEVLLGGRFSAAEATRLNQTDSAPTTAERLNFDLSIIDAVISDSGIGL